MIVKRLRAKHNWSQEQLSTFSGLSLRTIQRIESGQKASSESMKSLAAVFEVDIETLEQEFMVIDKNSQAWKQNPWWVRALFWGSNHIWLRSRKEAVLFEAIIVAATLAFVVSAFIQPNGERESLLILSLACGISAYLWSLLIRLSDRYHIWQTSH